MEALTVGRMRGGTLFLSRRTCGQCSFCAPGRLGFRLFYADAVKIGAVPSEPGHVSVPSSEPVELHQRSEYGWCSARNAGATSPANLSDLPTLCTIHL